MLFSCLRFVYANTRELLYKTVRYKTVSDITFVYYCFIAPPQVLFSCLEIVYANTLELLFKTVRYKTVSEVRFVYCCFIAPPVV